EFGRAEPDRQHAPAHIIPRDTRLAAEVIAKLLADDAPCAVAADEIVAGETLRLIVGKAGRLNRDAIAVIDKALDTPAEAQRDRGQLLGLGAQHALDIKLRAAMRQL